MDREKCRTCFTNLDSNDLYLKLNVKHRSSKLSLAEKLRLCVPAMDLSDIENSYICMQCTMQLETAYSFHITCMETEKKFQERLSELGIKSNRSTHSSLNLIDNEKKKAEMVCKTCNISFSSKNIFDLHNKVMHNESAKEHDDEEIIGFKKSRKGRGDRFQMVFLEDNRKTSSETSFKGNTSKTDEILPQKRPRRQTLPKNNYSEISDSFFYDIYEDSPANTSFTETGLRKSKKPKLASICNENEDVKPDIAYPLPTDVGDDSKESKNDKSPGGNKLLSCRFCSKKAVERALVTHIARAHKERCTRCLLCKRYYTNMRLHRKIYGCQLQNVWEGKSSESVNIQCEEGQGSMIYYIATEGNGYMCIVCWRKCRTLPDLEKHIASKHNDHMQCKLCQRRLMAFKYCAHIGQGCPKLMENNYVRGTRDGACVCLLCKKPYPKKTDLRAHLACHLFSNLECEHCKMPFPGITNCLDHLFKGCPENKSTGSGTVSVKASDSEMLPKIETSDEYPSSSTDDTNLKVEPTELVVPEGIIVDDSLTDKESADIPQLLNGECISNIDSVDEPELIFILQKD